jgi:hypothetical protein
MKRMLSGTLLLVALALSSACSDPTGDLRNGPAVISPSLNSITVNLGDSTTAKIDVLLQDAQGNGLPATFTVTTGDAAVATARVDTTFRPGLGGDRLLQRYLVNGISANTTALTFSAQGVTSKPVRVLVLPPKDLVAADLGINAAVAGDTVTMDLVNNPAFAGITFSLNTIVAFGADTAVVTQVTNGGKTIKFLPIPGSTGTASITTPLAYAPGVKATLKSVDALTVSAPVSFAGTFSTSTPAIQDTVTLTAAPGYKFLPTSTVSFGGVPTVRILVALDSNSLRFVPTPGSTSGPATVSNVVFDFLTNVPFTLPTASNMTVPAAYNATSFATAPTLTLPPSGATATYVDGGAYAADPTCTADLGGNCRIFKFTVAAASASLSFRATWQGTTDLGVYFYSSTPTLIAFGGCDAKGNGAGGQPETCTRTFTTGTYYAVADDFGPFYVPPEAAPTSLRLDISVN